MEFNTPYTGLTQVINPYAKFDYYGTLPTKMQFGMYRWHINNPVRFKNNFRMTIQALEWKRKMVLLEDDISSVAFWYQTEPHGTFLKVSDRTCLKVS